MTRQARVSTWLTFSQYQVQTDIQTAIADQLEHGVTATATPGRERVSPSSLQAELALMRHELTQTRLDLDRLRSKVQLAPGAELDEVTRHQLVDRLQQLERDYDRCSEAAREAHETIEALQTRLATTEGELLAARTSLRRLIKSENRRAEV